MGWNLKDDSIVSTETQLLVKHEQTILESIETSYSVY
jgi:hypothetical protein